MLKLHTVSGIINIASILHVCEHGTFLPIYVSLGPLNAVEFSLFMTFIFY